MAMTKEDILAEIKAVQANGVRIDPMELFTRDELENVEFVKGYRFKNQRMTEAFEKKQGQFDKLDSLKTEFEGKIKEKDTKIKTLTLENTKITSKDKFNKIVTERKLNEKQVEFIEKDWDNFTFDDPEKVDESLNKFVDGGIEKYKKNAEFFGFKDGETKPDPGAGPSESKDKTDLTDPKVNPLIPTD